MTDSAYHGISIALSILTFGIIAFVGLKTTILKENIPNVEARDRMYSLGRFQLWIWTLVICPAFILYWGFNADHSIDLNTTAVILLGLPASVAITSHVISGSQCGNLSPQDHLNAQVAAEQVSANSEANQQAVADAVAGNTDPSASATPTPAAVVPTKTTVLKMHQRSKSFFIDLISDDQGQLSLGRLQQLIFTIAFLVIYTTTFFSAKMATLPVFATEVFALMGISSGTYLVSKGMNK